jgi:hypothetical protein
MYNTFMFYYNPTTLLSQTSLLLFWVDIMYDRMEVSEYILLISVRDATALSIQIKLILVELLRIN